MKVTALEGKMCKVNHLFLGYLPDQYGNQRPSDPLGQAWNDAFNALFEAEDRLEGLGETLREMAGITWEEARERVVESQEQPVMAEPVST